MKANQFTNPKIRDLAWIITSHSLMDLSHSANSKLALPTWNHPLNLVTQNWLEQLDKTPEVLEAALGADQEKLTGKIFESYLKFFFSNHPDYELLASNIQLIEDKKTKGEIDLIVFDKISNKTLHIEAACKFYLSSTNQTSWSSWIGPNSIDSLDKKIAKLQQQIGNIESTCAQEYLQSNKLEINQSLCILKGYFFHHINQIQRHKKPLHCSKQYNSGIWVHFTELDVFDQHQDVWLLLSKDRWFAQLQTDEKGLTLKQLNSQIKKLLFQMKRPVLLSKIDQNGKEELRMFVVDDKWPH